MLPCGEAEYHRFVLTQRREAHDHRNQRRRADVHQRLHGLNREGRRFQGVLFAGIMLTAGGPKVLEYNVRFGDPECQVLMVRLGAQVLDLLLAAAERRLAGIKANWADDHAMTVVMAADGYPGSYEKGTEIRGLAQVQDATVFHAGTARAEDRILATGGRVLNVVARGGSVTEAKNTAYEAITHVDWPEGFCRSDIGWRAVEREKSAS